MINLLCPFHRIDHPVRLNPVFWLDLIWWQELSEMWDGRSFVLMLIWVPKLDFQDLQDPQALYTMEPSSIATGFLVPSLTYSTC